jgi:hypothetical protein
MSDIERLTSLPAQGSAASEAEVPLQHLGLESAEVVSLDPAPYLSNDNEWGFMASVTGRKTVKRRGSRRGISRGHKRHAGSACSSVSSGHTSPFLFGHDSFEQPDLLFHDSKSPTRRLSEDLSYLSISPKSRNQSVSKDTLHRDYILDQATPPRELALSIKEKPKRTRTYPMTFRCTLCRKGYTDAYNISSHFRTHTDERPFVCFVCGKAFARQHYRKRHRGFQAGEKKFICRGNLKDGNYWGCGRRFARVDALARHFGSKAGRVCIRPLYEEEQYPEKESDTYGSLSYPSWNHPLPSTSEDPDESSSSHLLQSQLTQLPSSLLAHYPGLADYPFMEHTSDHGDSDDSGSSFSRRGDILNGSIHGDAGNWPDDYDDRDLPRFESVASQVDHRTTQANLQSDGDQGLSFASQFLFPDYSKSEMGKIRDLSPWKYAGHSPVIKQYHVHWDLVGFMHTQFGDILPPVSSVVVLTGSAQHAYATTCGNYMKTTWPDTASYLLELLETMLKKTAHSHSYQKLLYQSRKCELPFSQ